MYEYLDRRYALALYEVAEEKGKVDKFLQDLMNGGILGITVEKNSCTFYMSAQDYFCDHDIDYTVNMDDPDDYYVDIV